MTWLHYVGGYTQEKIARRLGLSKPRVNRLIAAAHRNGMVRVFVEGAPETCMRLGEQLRTRFGLTNCHVVPANPLAPLDDQTLVSVASAAILQGYMESHDDALIGIGHGRTLARLVDRISGVSCPKIRLVSLLGSLTRRASTNPFDVVYRLAERIGAEGYVLPIPLIADSDADREVLLSQKGVRRILGLSRAIDLAVVGVGDLGDDGYWSTTGILTPEERAELVSLGAVGNILGRFVDSDGRPVDSAVTRRFLAVDLIDIGRAEVMAVGGGPRKVPVFTACLKAGLITQLVTDEHTAATLASAT